MRLIYFWLISRSPLNYQDRRADTKTISGEEEIGEPSRNEGAYKKAYHFLLSTAAPAPAEGF